VAGCVPQQPPTGLPALHKAETWTQAREVYFHTAKAPPRPYKWDGEKGEIFDVHIYKTPRPDLVLVTYGETYHNTTGWDVHLGIMRTNNIPTYPGNVYVCPVPGFNRAFDWIDDNTLAIYYPAGDYPDQRDHKSGRTTRSPTFEYEKKVGTIDVKFIAADRATMNAKQETMNAMEIIIGK